MTLMPRPMLIPRPRPLPPAPGPLIGALPSKRPAAAAYCYSLAGLRMVWSTERIVQAASVAAFNTLTLTISGSQTNISYISATVPFNTSTPCHLPVSTSWVCSYLNLFRISVESIPELSASYLGIISSALAKPLITSYCFPLIVLTCSRKYLESSISIAPPPATIACVLIALVTIIIASLRDRAASSMYYYAPPLITRVTVFVLEHSVNMLYLSFPSYFSSNFPHLPKTLSVMPLVVVWIAAPVALQTLSKSSWVTRPAQKISLSAKYWVAKSPIGSLERIILAPEAII